MFAMEEIDEDEFLSLRLAIATKNGGEKKRKRDRKEISDYSSSSNGYEEGKILTLLQTREQMLKKNDATHENGSKGLHLFRSLLASATSVNENKIDLAIENLFELYRNVCLTGDSAQRVAAYFADGLVAKLLTRKSPFYDAIVKHPTPDEEFLAFTAVYKVSPFYQFAHFTANQVILEAFEKEGDINSRVLHVIDFDVSYGFQWPSLMQSLSENSNTTNRVSLKITGFGKNLKQLQETESRLVSFAKTFSNLVFEFQGLVSSSEMLKFKRSKNETVAVNLVTFNLNSLNSFSKILEKLRFVRLINPLVVVLMEKEGTGHNNKFLARFMESLHYFTAIFDSLDDCLPVDSAERLIIEKNHLGKEIKSVINSDNGSDNCSISEKMESIGFSGTKLSSKCVMQAKLLLKIRSHCSAVKSGGDENGSFRVFGGDDGKAISLGWQERPLITASSWCCNNV